MNTIGRPWKMGTLEIKNSLVRSATDEGLSTKDGAPTQKLINAIVELARGGVGLIIAGTAYISREGRWGNTGTGMHHDRLIKPLSQLCRAVHNAGGILAAPFKEGSLLKYALQIKEKVNCPVISVEGWRNPLEITKALKKIDAVSMSRPFIREPDLANRWLGGDLSPALCISCNKCLDLTLKSGLGCIFHKHKKDGHS